jgi:type I restriction enzyme S subunit
MSLPRYPKYKPSGVEWLGDVPEGWEVDRIKRSVLSSKNGVWGAEPQQDESDIPCVRVADFDRQKLRVELSEPTIRNVVESERVGRVLCKGDLLLEKAGGGELQPVGCVVLYDDDRPAVCSNFVARVQVAPGMNASFWRYAHAAAYAVRLNTRSIKQTSGIQNLDGSQYFDERAAFPPLPEQTAIAEFLDRETAKIDGLVTEQRRLMELLKEKRQAVISHAVTKGLNPHAPMKPSGIEWLGDIPVGWEVFALNRLVQPGRRITYGIVQPGERDENGRFMVRGQDYSFGWAKPETIFKVSDAVEIPYRRARLSEGDLIITIVGAGVGNVEVVPSWLDGANITQTTARISVDKTKADPRFISAVLKGSIGRRSVELYAKGAAQPGLNLEHVRIFPITVPPLSEQREIADYIDTETKQFDTLTAEAQRAIDLLQERRTALITAAVTGQIDVRQQPKT